jgi:signal transduction histidine kinase
MTFRAGELRQREEAEEELREEVFDFAAFLEARARGQSPQDAAYAYLASWPADDREALVLRFNGEQPRVGGPIGIEPALLEAVTASSSRMLTITTSKGEGRVLTSPIRFGGREIGSLAIVNFLDEGRAALLERRVAVGAGALLAFLVASALAWSTLARLLRPVKTMAETASAISTSGDLDRRIPETGVRDEIGVLTGTFNRMLDRLEAAFHRERRFIRESSHELRTPITICRGYLEVLGPDPSPHEIREASEVVIDELARMGRIVEDMTTLARVDDPEFLRLEAVQLERFFGDLATKAEPLLNGRLNIQDSPAGAVIHADPQRLTQALINLLQNASVHSRSRDVDLRLASEPNGWRFEVTDRGRGLPPGEEELVFQPFRRGNGSAPGSGLGLAIVRGIAEAHGGSAGVENRPGEGATFWMRMPR